MASKDNVFSVFENYVNKEDVSFQFEDLTDTLDSSEDLTTAPSGKGRRAKKRSAVVSKKNSKESIDITEFFPSTTKSKRKLADQIGAPLKDAIDLCEGLSEVTAAIPKRGRRTIKTRQVSYKKALATSKMPLPELQEPPKAAVIIPAILPEPIVEPAAVVAQESSEEMYDLTGDVELTDKHSSAPLFQKPKEIAITPPFVSRDHNMSQEFDYDFDSISINVKINGKINKFNHRNVDLRFYDLFKKIAEKEKVPIDNIFIFDEKEKRILPDETPKSLGHKISSIYTCRLMDSSNTKVKKENRIELKFQSDKWKMPISLKVSQFESFLSCIKTLCKQVKFKPAQFSLEFDGEALSLSDTPMDLEFEGGEIVDCRIKA